MNSIPELIPEAKACEILHCSRGFLWGERQKGKITCFKIGNRVFYTEAILQEYLEKSMEPAWAT